MLQIFIVSSFLLAIPFLWGWNSLFFACNLYDLRSVLCAIFLQGVVEVWGASFQARSTWSVVQPVPQPVTTPIPSAPWSVSLAANVHVEQYSTTTAAYHQKPVRSIFLLLPQNLSSSFNDPKSSYKTFLWMFLGYKKVLLCLFFQVWL